MRRRHDPRTLGAAGCVVVSLLALWAWATTAGAATMVGTSGADRIVGTRGPDLLLGVGGRDTLLGRGGADRLFGGPGADRLDGGQGRDLLFGGPGRDLLVGGPGNDHLGARDGARDVVTCGTGRDTANVDFQDTVAADCEEVRRPFTRPGTPVAPRPGAVTPVTPRPPPPPPAPSPPPPPPAPSPPVATPANAAIEVYQVQIDGLTFRPFTTQFPTPDGTFSPIERVFESGVLARLVTPQPGIDGRPAADEIGIFAGSLSPQRAGAVRFASNTLFLSLLPESSFYRGLPYPFDIGSAERQGQDVFVRAGLEDFRRVTPPFGFPPNVFTTRTTAFASTIKRMNIAGLDARFAPDGASVEGVFEFQGGAGPGDIRTEQGQFGYAARFTGTRVSSPGGVPVFLPPPWSGAFPRPPGCRTELVLSPGLDGILRFQLEVRCA